MQIYMRYSGVADFIIGNASVFAGKIPIVSVKSQLRSVVQQWNHLVLQKRER